MCDKNEKKTNFSLNAWKDWRLNAINEQKENRRINSEIVLKNRLVKEIESVFRQLGQQYKKSELSGRFSKLLNEAIEEATGI